MWGIIPAAGNGSRMQPLAFSKELLPVGSRLDGTVERPRAVSEYLVARMLRAGVDKLCFVISPGKADILQYYGGSLGTAAISYVVQQRPSGLCDAIFCAAPFIGPEETIVVGLPDTVWFPEDGFLVLPDHTLSFLLFPVDRPELFDVVIADDSGRVHEIQVKQHAPHSRWIWGAFKLNGVLLHELRALWLERERSDEYIGTLINAWISCGGRALGIHAGNSYVDVGTLHGYREAIRLLSAVPSDPAFRPAEAPQPA